MWTLWEKVTAFVQNAKYAEEDNIATFLWPHCDTILAIFMCNYLFITI